MLEDLGGNAIVLIAKHEACWVVGVEFVGSGLALFRNGHGSKSELVHGAHGLGHVLDPAHGQPKQGSGRRLDGIFVDGGRARHRDHDARGSEALRRARNGAKIAYVGHAIQGQHEWVFASLKGPEDDFVKRLKFDGGSKGNDALVVLAGDAVEAFLGDRLRGDFQCSALPKDFADLVGLLAFQEKQALQGFALFESFENGVDAKQKSSFRWSDRKSVV